MTERVQNATVVGSKIVVRNARSVSSGKKLFEAKLRFLLNYQNGASDSNDSDPDSNFFMRRTLKPMTYSIFLRMK